MKKVFSVVCFIFIALALISGCGNNDNGPSGPSATPTITPTSTATPWATISIQALLRGQDNNGTAGTNPMPLAWCDIYVSENATPCTDATVSVNLTPVPAIATPGQYSLSTTSGYYAAGQTATVKVTINGVDFTGSVRYPGAQTFTASNLTVSWLYEGNLDIVAVYDPSNAQVYTTGSGGNANSPVVLSPSLFTASGEYSVRMYAKDRQTGVFSGPGITSSSYIEVLGFNFMSYIVP